MVCSKKLILLGVGLTFSAGALYATPLTNPSSPKLNTRALLFKQRELRMQQQILQSQQQTLRLQHYLTNLKKQAKHSQTHPKKQYFTWKKMKVGILPKQGVVVGFDRKGALYVCHSFHVDGIHPGQLTKKGCLVSYGGTTYLQKHFSVLTGKHPIIWKPSNALAYNNNPSFYPAPMEPGPEALVNSDGAPLNVATPVKGGHEHGRPLYICRTMYRNDIHVGKVVKRLCNIGLDHREIKIPTYQVMFVGSLAHQKTGS